MQLTAIRDGMPPSWLQIPTVHNRRDGSTDITTWALVTERRNCTSKGLDSDDTRKLSIPWAVRQDSTPCRSPSLFFDPQLRGPRFLQLGSHGLFCFEGPFCSGESQETKTVRYHRNCSEPIFIFFARTARTPSQLPALPGPFPFWLLSLLLSRPQDLVLTSVGQTLVGGVGCRTWREASSVSWYSYASKGQAVLAGSHLPHARRLAWHLQSRVLAFPFAQLCTMRATPLLGNVSTMP
ncbi:hypothetical protein BDP55DRAFT_717800 [Colletotrichum godetiae]|uniref:Uncharacterized protein n=1 Tax=Colletotrichum godetiae TaxID=1209918 RepID=A0AAJ0AFD5_9PEZI|nr:uncharacterized protein BDP55DRAFT_717800 [Colletotrichum godetiae]KAK1672855.1 hypothetical protein BDP55DRAFT_717800 [Colletotrichum godetiae]